MLAIAAAAPLPLATHSFLQIVAVHEPLCAVCLCDCCAALFGVCPPGHGRNFERFAESYEAVDVFNKRAKVSIARKTCGTLPAPLSHL
jgi:hypothetical protein